jgi:biopolymer transport protein ExbD
MQLQSEHKPFDDINVTPMLDLAYVLLVIFIIMTTASVQGIKVNLPKASNTPSLAKPKTKAITINEQGAIFLDAYPVTIQELETRMRQYKSADADIPVVIKGDSKVHYEKVVEVLELCSRLDITQLGLVTQRLTK